MRARAVEIAASSFPAVGATSFGGLFALHVEGPGFVEVRALDCLSIVRMVEKIEGVSYERIARLGPSDSVVWPVFGAFSIDAQASGTGMSVDDETGVYNLGDANSRVQARWSLRYPIRPSAVSAGPPSPATATMIAYPPHGLYRATIRNGSTPSTVSVYSHEWSGTGSAARETIYLPAYSAQPIDLGPGGYVSVSSPAECRIFWSRLGGV